MEYTVTVFKSFFVFLFSPFFMTAVVVKDQNSDAGDLFFLGGAWIAWIALWGLIVLTVYVI